MEPTQFNNRKIEKIYYSFLTSDFSTYYFAPALRYDRHSRLCGHKQPAGQQGRSIRADARQAIQTSEGGSQQGQGWKRRLTLPVGPSPRILIGKFVGGADGWSATRR
jgi:hypothetical protein